jgi:hypothetical protein
MSEATFALDEHLPTALARGLVRRGIEAVTFGELGRAGLPDAEQVAWAAVEEFAIVTHDDDYLAIVDDLAGIAFCRAHKHSIGGMIRAIERARQHWPDRTHWRGQVAYL